MVSRASVATAAAAKGSGDIPVHALNAIPIIRQRVSYAVTVKASKDKSYTTF